VSLPSIPASISTRRRLRQLEAFAAAVPRELVDRNGDAVAPTPSIPPDLTTSRSIDLLCGFISTVSTLPSLLSSYRRRRSLDPRHVLLVRGLGIGARGAALTGRRRGVAARRGLWAKTGVAAKVTAVAATIREVRILDLTRNGYHRLNKR